MYIFSALLNAAISPPTALVIQGNSQTITYSVTGSPIVTGISWTRENNAGLIGTSVYANYKKNQT